MSAQGHSPDDRAAALRETIVSILLIDDPERSKLRACVGKVAPEDVAAVLDDFEPDEKLLIFQAILTREDQAIVLDETDPGSRTDVFDCLSETERREILGEMPVDEVVDLIEERPESEQESLIADLETEEAEEVRELRQYDPETAGGMMTPDFLTVSITASSGEALATIQGNIEAEVINYIYVVDAGGKLEGVVSIRDLLRARPESPVDSYMESDVRVVTLDADREDVVSVADKYNIPVIPVVDDEDHIRGIVTPDDVLDAVQDEHSEDIFRLAGTTSIHPYFEPILVGVRKRLPFLLVTMTGAFLVLYVLESFKGAIEDGADDANMLLIMMLPILHLISGLSGNVAVVTSTVFVRAFATGEIGRGRLLRAVFQEVLIGCMIGCIMATFVGLVLAVFPFDDNFGDIGVNEILVVAAGLCASVTWAGVIGALVPVGCRLTNKIDPAIASGPFVTITVDVSASFIFFLFVVTFLTGG